MMTVAAHEPRWPKVGAWLSPEELQQLVPFVRLLAEIWSIPSVRKVAYSSDGVHVELWVFVDDPELDRDVLDDEGRIHLLERDYVSQTGMLPFDLRVRPASAADSPDLPPSRTILER